MYLIPLPVPFGHGLARTTADRKRGIQWNFHSVLENLDFADDISLLSSRRDDIQEKMNRLTSFTKLMKLNTTNNQSVTVNNQQLEEVDEFTYLGSKVSTDCDSVLPRLSMAKQAFGILNPVWKSTKFNFRTKIRIFKSNVLSVLLYGRECWKVTREISRNLTSSKTKRFQRIKRIFWPNRISNKYLLASCNLEPLSVVVRRRR